MKLSQASVLMYNLLARIDSLTEYYQLNRWMYAVQYTLLWSGVKYLWRWEWFNIFIWSPVRLCNVYAYKDVNSIRKLCVWLATNTLGNEEQPYSCDKDYVYLTHVWLIQVTLEHYVDHTIICHLQFPLQCHTFLRRKKWFDLRRFFEYLKTYQHMLYIGCFFNGEIYEGVDLAKQKQPD